MVTIFFTRRELIVLDVRPKGSKFNQLYFIDYIFPDLKSSNLNFRRRKPGLTFWVHMDNSTCHNGSKVASKFEKYHIFRLPHPPYSPEISPCDYWLFGLLKGIMNISLGPPEKVNDQAIQTAHPDFVYTKKGMNRKGSL
jgi:hypothetical protein